MKLLATLILALAVSACSSVITEDDPRWDCRTMGNKVCGSQLASASPTPPQPPVAPNNVHYCNAPTKKGTPCKHRVKTEGTRCWQHKG